ncbi:MAG: acyltransferase, partial [Pseudomonadota bacterium]
MTSLNASPPRDQTVTGARLTYRPEIDGLRAIAVLSVLLFHSHVPGFSGGYVGVDVFFVISGYIITCIVCREREAGQFSVAAFYERRIRRIAPALFVMSFGVLVLGAVLLPATHLKTLFGDVAAVSLLVSNLWQESQVSYFGALAKDRALIHTWSLSLEEQFYL